MHVVIRPRRGWLNLDLREMWAYRELLGFLAWRDILVRYKQTTVGILWALIRPALSLAVLTFVFGRVAKLPSEGVPYALLTLVGVLPWQLFLNGFTESSGSVLGSSTMVSKIYFPRLIIPISSVLGAVVDFLVAALLLAGLLIYYGVAPSPIRLLALFPLVAICFLFTTGLGIFFSAIVVKYRDVRHVLPFATQLLLYVSPVGFSSTIVPERYRPLYDLNPLVAVIDGFRWAILDTRPPEIASIISSAVIAIATLIIGAFFFRRTERYFADLI
jgi:lipopolysaccharide transport system permease protein